ncbi:hypothetical protein G9A89_017522 [Geosiphon pyriformis]|nr:hypothetical protein G9A89_017522 [Geosiphon pyriformis]
MTYIPIAKLKKFMEEEDNAQIWLNDIEKTIMANGWNDVRALQTISYFLQNTTNSWYQSLANKSQDFNTFKLAFLQYFSNNNSINQLANTFITIKQGENKAVTTYLRCIHRNLCQIQTIQTDYFTASQILNQFIRSLSSSIFQCVCLMHSTDLQATITNARDFETTELKANHAQAINLVMNRSSDLNSKLKQFSKSINQKLEGYLLCPTSFLTNQQWQQEICVCHYCDKQGHLQFECCKKISNLRSYITNSIYNLSTTVVTSNVSNTSNLNSKLSSDNIRKFQIQSYSKLEISNGCLPTNLQLFKPAIKITLNYLSLLVTPKDTSFNNMKLNQKQPLISNIPLATITNDKLLTVIFPFEFEELISMFLFSRAILKKKPITTMYTDAKVDGHSIKLILNNGIVNAKVKEVTLSKILKIKNNPPEPVDIVLISNSNAFFDIETGPEEFYEHYQNLAATKEEQKQHLEEINI